MGMGGGRHAPPLGVHQTPAPSPASPHPALALLQDPVLHPCAALTDTHGTSSVGEEGEKGPWRSPCSKSPSAPTFLSKA